jgi:hypothetical protein
LPMVGAQGVRDAAGGRPRKTCMDADLLESGAGRPAGGRACHLPCAPEARPFPPSGADRARERQPVAEEGIGDGEVARAPRASPAPAASRRARSLASSSAHRASASPPSMRMDAPGQASPWCSEQVQRPGALRAQPHGAAARRRGSGARRRPRSRGSPP